jgi:hypothetical protein
MQYINMLKGYKTQLGFALAGLVWTLEAIGLAPDGTLAGMTPLLIAIIGAAGAAKIQKLVDK